MHEKSLTTVDIIENIELEKSLLNNGVVIKCKDDSYAGVLHTDEEMALYMSHGISVIIDVSGFINADVVKAVLRFCHTADENVGDLSIIVSVDHPRLQNILRLREAHNRLAIRVNDAFMQALVDNTRYGNEDNGFEPESLWNQIAHCNIMFSRKEFTPYCGFKVSHVNLVDYVVYGREQSTFDIESFKNKCDELLQQGVEQIGQYKQNLSAIVSSLDSGNENEFSLMKKLLDNTSNNCTNFVYATGTDAMLQKMELQPDSPEAVELLAHIDQCCYHRIEMVSKAYNGRTNEHKAASIKAWTSKCDELRIARDRKTSQHYMADEEHILKRPVVLEADVVRFQNKKEKWIAFIGLIDGRPYEVFTGIADDDEGIFCPKSVNYGKIIKAVDEHGQKRYDFQFINKRGFKTTIEGLSEKFNPEFWNYAKLISGVLRYGMPIEQVVKLVSSLELNNIDINNWKSGVVKALKKYLPNPDPES